MSRPHTPSTTDDADDSALGGRLPLLRPDALTGEQRPLYDDLVKRQVSWADKSGFEAMTADGRLIGPFNAMLYGPALGQASIDYLEAEREHTTLSPTVREVVILTVGAAFSSDYEQYAHTAVAKSAGLPDDALDAIKAGRAPEQLGEPEQAAHAFTDELARAHRVGDATYRRGVAAFGERGLTDLIHLAGLYMTVSSLLNAFEVPAPTAAG